MYAKVKKNILLNPREIIHRCCNIDTGCPKNHDMRCFIDSGYKNGTIENPWNPQVNLIMSSIEEKIQNHSFLEDSGISSWTWASTDDFQTEFDCS